MTQRIGIVLVLLAILATPGLAQNRVMVVHLPEAPIESMGKLADGVTQLAALLSRSVSGLSLEVKAFRKYEDALGFIGGQSEAVALVACDAAFVLELPPGFEVRHRFVRAGRETRRKLVVVRSDSGFASLGDLRGRTLTVALANGPSAAGFLTRTIFGRDVDAASWFGDIVYETDEFTATAAVLYGRTDGALVSEDNPLLATNLGRDLTEVYASPPVSMAVIAVRDGALTSAQLAALGQALDGLSGNAEAEALRAALLVDGFRRVDGARLLADLRGVAPVRRELEVALPALGPMPVDPLPELGPDEVPFVVGIELTEVEIPSSLVDSVLKEKAQ